MFIVKVLMFIVEPQRFIVAVQRFIVEAQNLNDAVLMSNFYPCNLNNHQGSAARCEDCGIGGLAA